jgi:hypothetical protein
MTDLPPPAMSPSPEYAAGAPGPVPRQVGGAYYSTGLVILLTFVTCGVWGALWTYRTSEDLKKHNGTGLGGAIGVVLYIFVSPVLMFTIPNEIEQMYRRDGRPSPVSAVYGLWFLLPVIGNIIWYVKVQRALNDYWLIKGALPG